MLFSLAYCWIIAWFLSWSSRAKSSLSKDSIVFLFNRFLSCIFLFSFGLNKFSKKYIWKILQVTQFRSCTLSSTIYIFTKSPSLSLLPKVCTKLKKFIAVSLKASSSLFVKLLQTLRLNLMFARVILLSVLVICLVSNKIFSNFLSHQFLKNQIKNISFRFNVEYAPSVHSALARGICISNYEQIF